MTLRMVLTLLWHGTIKIWEYYQSPITIQILELIKINKKDPRSDPLRDSRELAWTHRLDTLIPSDLNMMD